MDTARSPKGPKAPKTQTRDAHSWTISYGLAGKGSVIIRTLNL